MKPFEKLTFHDDFMFGIIMQDKKICKEALECLLGIKIDHLEYSEPQKIIAPLYTAHGIRLDVYVNDGKKVYDVEIQNRDEKDLGKRTRYYQGLMDCEALLKGQNYDELRESIIIFLCRFDPFKKAIPCYTVQRKCIEKSDIVINDGASVKVFNCTAYDSVKNASLRAFLKFVQNDSAESDFTRRISSMVEAQKQTEEMKKVYFSWSLHDHDVRKHGIAIGKKTNAVETAQNALAQGLEPSLIAKITGLSVEDVQAIANGTYVFDFKEYDDEEDFS